jgi:hypothetical protein
MVKGTAYLQHDKMNGIPLIPVRAARDPERKPAVKPDLASFE